MHVHIAHILWDGVEYMFMCANVRVFLCCMMYAYFQQLSSVSLRHASYTHAVFTSGMSPLPPAVNHLFLHPCAYTHNSVLFLDEPTTGLDATTSSSVLALLKRLAEVRRLRHDLKRSNFDTLLRGRLYAAKACSYLECVLLPCACVPRFCTCVRRFCTCVPTLYMFLLSPIIVTPYTTKVTSCTKRYLILSNQHSTQVTVLRDHQDIRTWLKHHTDGLIYLNEQHGRTIILSIHQPRFKIFDMFDTLTLLSEGLLSYHGPANEVCMYVLLLYLMDLLGMSVILGLCFDTIWLVILVCSCECADFCLICRLSAIFRPSDTLALSSTTLLTTFSMLSRVKRQHRYATEYTCIQVCVCVACTKCRNLMSPERVRIDTHARAQRYLSNMPWEGLLSWMTGTLEKWCSLENRRVHRYWHVGIHAGRGWGSWRLRRQRREEKAHQGSPSKE